MIGFLSVIKSKGVLDEVILQLALPYSRPLDKNCDFMKFYAQEEISGPKCSDR